MGKPLFGPKNGFRNEGDIQCKNLSVSGTITAGATVDTGVIDGNVSIGAGHNLGAEAGAGKADFSPMTGVFKTPTGKNTLSGDVDVASGKDIVSLGGDAKFDFSAASGVFKTSTGDNALGGDTYLAADKDLKGTAGTGEVDFSMLTGTLKTPTGAHTLNGDVTIASGKKLTAGPIAQRLLSKAANYPITDTDPDIVLVDASAATRTITLPTAADNTGRIITVIVAVEPAANNVVVDGEGAETINGVATKTNSDLYSFISMLCIGTAWIIVGSGGTWT